MNIDVDDNVVSNFVDCCKVDNMFHDVIYDINYDVEFDCKYYEQTNFIAKKKILFNEFFFNLLTFVVKRIILFF